MTLRHADTTQATDAATVKTTKQRSIDALITALPSVLLLRDGELVLYRRTRSLLYQCRFKLADGKWQVAQIFNTPCQFGKRHCGCLRYV